MVGTRLGGYEVVAAIGSGGMGEVYRARDLRLERDVAIKMLPRAFAADADRLARFAREARLLAALNHPNIGAIYGIVEDADGVGALVLEFVEGSTLAERLLHGPVPVNEAIGLARQIADALEAAHEKGIVHRDLKPTNIKVTSGGAIKVLDFGIAKAVQEGADLARPDSPTLTTAGTRPGVVLGTPAYMSPEQARGQQPDKRTDIWSFGCVLYEMLTGVAPFKDTTVSDTLSGILTREPDWSALPRNTPPHVRILLRRCLEKDPKRRLRDSGDARIELDTPTATEPATTPSTRTVGGWARVAALAVLVVGSLAIMAWGWLRPELTAPSAPVRMTVRLAPGTSVTRGPQFASSVALSPDGRLLVIAGKDAAGQRLYSRPLDRLDATPLPGTEGGSGPFFSPDGSWIGFFVAGRLKRVPSNGGTSVDITSEVTPQIPRGAVWLPDNRIVFGTGAFTGLQVVRSEGGTPQPLTSFDERVGEVSHADPAILPDGRTLLFASTGQSGSWINTLDLASAQRTRIVEGAAPRYAASGQLVISRGTNLFAAAWDDSRTAPSGSVVPLVEGIATESTGARHFAISPDGTLAYVAAPRTHSLVLVKDGAERVIAGDAMSFENPQFSPQEDRVVVAARRRNDDATDLWLHDVKTGTGSRLTFDGARSPVWTPDGSSVTYSHFGEQAGIYTKRADGQEPARRVVALSSAHWLVGWTPDGGTLLYGVMDAPAPTGKSPSSIVAITRGQSRTIVGPGQVWGGRLSPSGRLLVYYSLEPSGFEIYVTPFPEADTRWLVAEGTDPAWARDGGEIYFRSGDRLMAARVDTAAGVRVLSKRVVIEPFSPPLYDDYDSTSDKRTLVLVRPVGEAIGREVTVVLNWFAELRRATALRTN
jgi:Tol biopolymer transport system component